MAFFSLPGTAHLVLTGAAKTSHQFRDSVPLAVFICAGSSLLAQPHHPELRPGATVERELSGGQTHEYRFTLQSGQFARVRADQKSINLAIACFGPSGKQLSSADAWPIGDQESAELIAERSGVYRIRLKAAEPYAPAGRYRISLENFEDATQRHRERVAAARAFAAGMDPSLRNTRQAMLVGVRRLSEALAHWRAAGDAVETAKTLNATSLLYIETGDQQKALQYATMALEAARAAGDRRIEARALNSVAEVYNYFGDKRKAIAYYEQALPLMRASGDRAGEGNAMNNLAVACAHTGEKQRAVALYGQAEEIFRELQDRRMIAEVAGNLGVTLDNLGEYQKALETHQRDLAIKRELNERAAQALSLNNIGTAYSGLGEYQKALDAYTAALEINRLSGNRRNIAINLNNIAWIYDQLASYPRALTFFEESLAILRKMNDRRTLAVTLNNIAGIHAASGDYRKAAAVYSEALAFRRAASDTDGEANTLNHLGAVLAKLGNKEKARDLFERSLSIHRSSGNPYMLARTLTNLGMLDREAGDSLQALTHLNEAVSIARTIRDRNGEAAALTETARVECARGNFAAAHQRAQEALAALESLRLSVASPALRASFFAAARDIQEIDVEALMCLHAEHADSGYDAEALSVTERGRARSLLELLAGSSAEVRRGVDAGLRGRERELERLISAKAERQMRLLSGPHSNAEAAGAEREMQSLTAELEQVQSKIRETSPEYAALTQPVPLNLREIQTKVLDDSTVLLEYALGSERSFLWAVTPTSSEIFQLAPRAVIESSARRVYSILTARNQIRAGETPESRAERVRRADQAWRSAADRASGLLLGAVASRIKNKRLLIIGEGVLQYLPFGALPEPGAAGGVPLIVNHEIITAPSASVIAVLRRETANRKPAEKEVAILADPVFSADDSRIPSHKATRPDAAPGIPEFVRLRFSRYEAEEIARLAPAGSTLQALDFTASRETALKPELGSYRIVHFATHSVLDDKHPELSGIVLSLFDASGVRRNGFLRLYDIYNLRLGADLVVLSACQTALGTEIKGEGLMGLTRGFLYAGAPRVVASLWKVDDRATAELMKRFYDGMLRHGERPAAALRAAQVALWRNKGLSAPFYWAAFTLQGEWR